MYLIVFVDKEVSVCTRPYNFKYGAVHYNTTRMEKTLLYNTVVSVLVGIISCTLHYTTLHYTTLMEKSLLYNTVVSVLVGITSSTLHYSTPHYTHGEEPIV